MSSDIWRYFTVDASNDHFAICKFCQRPFSRGHKSKNTSNLWKHLQVHSKEMEMEKKRKSKPIDEALEIDVDEDDMHEAGPSSASSSITR